MPSISFITIADYKATLQQDVGGLMFPGHLYECGRNIDKDKLRKDFKELKGKRVHAVLIYTEESPKFSKEQNTLVKYKTPSVADKDQEGAFQREHEHPQIAQMWWSNHPMGDVIVVYLEPKPKEKKVEGVPTKAELKTLRRKWQDLKDDYEDDYEYLEDEEWMNARQAMRDDLLKRAIVLHHHDTPFIQRKMISWAKDTFGTRRIDDKLRCGTDDLYIEFAK